MQDRSQKYSVVSKQPVLHTGSVQCTVPTFVSKQPVLHTGSVQCTLPTFVRLFTQIKGESRKINLMPGTAGDGFRVGTFFFFTECSFSFCMYNSACHRHEQVVAVRGTGSGPTA